MDFSYAWMRHVYFILVVSYLKKRVWMPLLVFIKKFRKITKERNAIYRKGEGPYCIRCWENEGKFRSIRQAVAEAGQSGGYCMTCRTYHLDIYE